MEHSWKINTRYPLKVLLHFYMTLSNEWKINLWCSLPGGPEGPWSPIMTRPGLPFSPLKPGSPANTSVLVREIVQKVLGYATNLTFILPLRPLIPGYPGRPGWPGSPLEPLSPGRPLSPWGPIGPGGPGDPAWLWHLVQLLCWLLSINRGSSAGRIDNEIVSFGENT